MADLKEINLNKDKKSLISQHFLYVLVYFVYSVLIMFIFQFFQPETGLNDNYAYYFGVIFLLPHHLAFMLSLLLYVFAWAFNNRLLVVLSMVADLFASLFLVYAAFTLFLNPNGLTLPPLLLTALPLFGLSLLLIRFAVKKFQLYFRR